MNPMLKESQLDPSTAVYSEILRAGDPWVMTIKKGQIWRIVDEIGNQSVDTLLFDANDTRQRYSVNATLANQGKALIELGTQIFSNDGNPMLTVIADTCGEHDTLGSGCSAEGNVIRYTQKARYMHSCRDTFVSQLAKIPNMSKLDQTCNLNFFTKVILDSAGRLEFADGISGAGKYVEMRAEMDLLVVISNCSQLNNPCNDYNPSQVRMIIWNG